MGTTITFRRGENDPTSGSGLTLAEPAFNTTLHTFHIGLGYGITAAWVGAPISGLSADIAAGITYKIPSAAAVKNYIGGLCFGNTGGGGGGAVSSVSGSGNGISVSPTTGAVVVSNTGVHSFNGLTGAIQGVSSWNGQTGAVSFVNYVVSFNGLTGAVGGVTTSAANTFVPMQSFSGGISAAGGTFSKLAVFISGIESAGITASTVTSEGTSTIPGYPGYASTTTVSADTINFVFDGVGGQILRPTDDNIDGSTRTNYLPASSGTLALTSQLMGSVNGSTASTTAVTSFNGRTGAVQGVSSAAAGTGISVSAATGAITITNTGVQSFNGSTGAVTGASLGANTFTGLNTFSAGLCAAGITVSGNIRFSGTSAKTISSNQATLTIAGASASSVLVGSNSVVMGVQVTDSLTLNSATSIVDISTTTSGQYPSIPSIRILTDDADTIGAGSIKIIPASYATANRTQYLQDANGTIALTSQLMGAVNGSTAATTAVTSFNGSTGAVQGVSSFNGLTGAVGGVCAAQANTFTALQSFNSGISSAGGTFTQETRFASGLSASVVKTLNLSGYGGLSPSFIDGQFRLSQFMGTFTTVQSSGSTDRSITLPDADGTLALTSQLMGTVNGSTAATTAVTSFNGLTGAVTGVTVGGVNTFTQVNTFSAGISAAGSTFSSTTNTLDVIASTEGAGLRIARATSGVGSRIGGIRLGRSTTTNQNTYIEGSAGTFSLYNGVDNTGTVFAAFSPSQFTLGTTLASFISLNCPNNISFGDQSSVGNNQIFDISGTNRTYTFGDPNGVTTGFVGINRSGLCGDYALEVNSPTGKGLQLVYNDHTGAASNWVNFTVSSTGDLTVAPSGGYVAVNGNLTANNIVNAVNGRTGGITLAAGTGITLSTVGNTITITSTVTGGTGGGTTNSTTQTVDFSELIDQIEVVIWGSGGDFGTLLTYFENYTINGIAFDTNSFSGYTAIPQSIKSFYDPTNGWSARVVFKPPFTKPHPSASTTAAGIVAETINAIYIDTPVIVDYWTNIQSQTVLHKEATYTTKTVTGQTWVTADSFITCKVLGLTTDDHIPEDASLEGVRFEIDNIVAGTGFDIIGHAPEGTYGKYSVKCLGQ